MNIKMIEYAIKSEQDNIKWLKTKPQTWEMKQRIATLELFLHHNQERLKDVQFIEWRKNHKFIRVRNNE
jgi:hypothetical protein